MEQSEDCLTLNVWTPALDGRQRPVMVWIHGGGFTSGTGGSLLYRGGELVRRGDVVVVTCNYRLGALGFLAHPSLSFSTQGGESVGNWDSSTSWPPFARCATTSPASAVTRPT